MTASKYYEKIGGGVDGECAGLASEVRERLREMLTHRVGGGGGRLMATGVGAVGGGGDAP